ncbi:DHH family phosphoesterase [Phragmitibacter flavus]|nr:bifunctional oligoribonuclease/PAP phosphatase NrnA [Phragmitibacter flavus]
MNDSFDHIGEVLRNAETIAIAGHVRPDGDAIGSIVALGHSLMLAGKKVRILSEDKVPLNLAFLPEVGLVEQPPESIENLDVAVALDTAVKDRLGDNVNRVFAGAKVLVNMDHHGTNPRYGHLNYIEMTSPATGQIIFDFLKSQGLPMDAVVRDHLYTAISTDTGSFQFSSTTAHTHRIIAEMMEAGSQFWELCQKLYNTFPLRRLLLQKALLNEMKLSAGNRIASWAMSHELQSEIGTQPGDTEGLIDMLRGIDGVISPVIFEEMADGRVRVSVRSKDERLDVSKVCLVFGGGGHRMASGARMAGPLAVAEQRFLEALEDEIKRIG